jgi:hypothetical protein
MRSASAARAKSHDLNISLWASQHKIIALRYPYARLLVCRKMQRACVGTYLLQMARGPVDSHLRLPNYSPQNIVRACLTLNPGERAKALSLARSVHALHS